MNKWGYVALILAGLGFLLWVASSMGAYVNENNAKLHEPSVVSEVSKDMPSITAEELFVMLRDNPYNAKVTFERPTKITGTVKSISTNGMSISIGNDDVSVDCSVRGIYALGMVYKYTDDGKEVTIEQRDVFKKYSQQLSKGDPITLIGSELYEKNEEPGYIIVVKNFDIEDMIVNMGLESKNDLFELFGLLEDE